jgi:HAD superfamily hydrolase (TIGR01509 family)
MAVYVEMMDLPVSPEELLSMMHERMVRDIHDKLVMMPGANDILNFYHKRIPMALATGSSSIILNAVLEKTQMAKYFDVIVSADVVERGKPDPAIFLYASKKLNVESHEVVILEDAQNGVIAGHDAGAYVIAVPNRFTIGADFSKADIVVNNLFQANDHIETLRR